MVAVQGSGRSTALHPAYALCCCSLSGYMQAGKSMADPRCRWVSPLESDRTAFLVY